MACTMRGEKKRSEAPVGTVSLKGFIKNKSFVYFMFWVLNFR